MICSEMQTGFHKEGVISDTNQDSVINLLPFHPPLKGQSCRAFDFFKVVNIYNKIYCIFKFLYHFGGLSALSLVEGRACCMTNQTTAAKEATSNSLRTLVCIFMHLINNFLSLFSSWRRLSHHMVFLWKCFFPLLFLKYSTYLTFYFKSDLHLISPYNINPESNIKVTRIKEMITY